jgi:hypothetical protein
MLVIYLYFQFFLNNIIMSFNNYNKPKLVDSKIYKYYNNKIRTLERREQIKQQELENIPVIRHVNWYNKIYVNICIFIKDNYGLFLIFTLISILLYVRYIEVNLRKKKMKNVIDKINNEKEIEQFIKLQKLNEQLSQFE